MLHKFAFQNDWHRFIHAMDKRGMRLAMSRAAMCVCMIGTALPVHAAADFTDGVWLTQGYGQAFSITGARLDRYEITRISCLGLLTADRQTSAPARARFVGTQANPDTGAKDAFVFTPGIDENHLNLHVEGAISDIHLRRIHALPQACARHTRDDPLTNFDIFARTFSEQYAFFKLRHMNWAAVTAAHRRKIGRHTTGRELFAHFRAMIAPLLDAHTSIDADALDLSFDGWHPPAPISDAARQRAKTIIEHRYLVTPLRPYCNDQLAFGMLPGGIGYLRISSFENYSKDADFAAQTAALGTALDAIFERKPALRGLVVDVRLNDGGADEFGTMIAGRLTTRPYLAYRKVFRVDPEDPARLGAPQSFMVEPSTRPSFHGAVALLIGHESVSAAETFPMALQGRVPKPVFVGENTQGVFSDVLNRHLPNGWTFGVPNEIYLTKGGRAYDLVGVPPDKRVPVFRRADLQRGRDPALETALRIVQRQAARDDAQPEAQIPDK